MVFENQLKHPSTLNLIDESPINYIMQYKMNFNNWRIVDFDHFMNGNSFFSKKITPKQYREDVEKNIGKRENSHVKLET